MLTVGPTLNMPAWLPQPFAPDRGAVFVADSLDDWASEESLEYNGLLLRRPFAGKWDAFEGDIGECESRTVPASATSARQFAISVDKLLQDAALPAPLSQQIRDDACSLRNAWSAMYPGVRELQVKLEVFGENTCARWHQDHFVGRGIVSYTGEVGTEYTRSSNINFWELEHCGNNDCVIHDPKAIESVAVGDMLLIKGTKFPGARPQGPFTDRSAHHALVHKSPEVRYHSNGRVLNRLVLKVDVISPPTEAK